MLWNRIHGSKSQVLKASCRMQSELLEHDHKTHVRSHKHTSPHDHLATERFESNWKIHVSKHCDVKCAPKFDSGTCFRCTSAPKFDSITFSSCFWIMPCFVFGYIQWTVFLCFDFYGPRADHNYCTRNMVGQWSRQWVQQVHNAATSRNCAYRSFHYPLMVPCAHATHYPFCRHQYSRAEVCQ